MKKLNYVSIYALAFLISAVVVAKIFAMGQSAQGDGKPKFFLITMDSLDEHWLSIRDGAQAKLNELDSSIELVFLAPPQKADPSEQIRIVEDAITQQASAIILAPTDKTALAPIVKKIKERGIPLVLVDSPVDIDDSYYVTFASTDNYQAATMAADTLAKLIGNKGKVAMIHGQPGAGTTILREKGFADRLKEKYPNIQLIARQYSNGDKLLALDQATDIIRGNPDLAGFYGGNEGATVGIAKAVESATQNKIALVGFDKSSDIIAGIEKGIIDASMVQNPEEMGRIAVESLYKVLQNPSVPIEKAVDTGVMVVGKDNLSVLKK